MAANLAHTAGNLEGREEEGDECEDGRGQERKRKRGGIGGEVKSERREERGEKERCRGKILLLSPPTCVQIMHESNTHCQLHI